MAAATDAPKLIERHQANISQRITLDEPITAAKRAWLLVPEPPRNWRTTAGWAKAALDQEAAGLSGCNSNCSPKFADKLPPKSWDPVFFRVQRRTIETEFRYKTSHKVTSWDGLRSILRN